MATVTELRGRAHAEIAYVLAIEGIPHMWATNDALVGSGVSSWIGTGYGGRVVLGGLQVPDSVEYSIKDGLPVDSGATFGLVDHDGTVAGYFGNVEPEDLDFTEERLVASSSAAPLTLLSNGDAIIVHDRNIGIEAIGPSGERRHFPCFPNANLPGLHHASASGELEGALTPVPITQDPHLLEGRRVALWRLYRDDDGSWADWSTQAAAGPPIFWGTLRQLGRVSGRVWRIKCDGPESLLRKLLNSTGPSEWRTATPEFFLRSTEGQREDLIGVGFKKVYANGDTTNNGARLFDTGDAITNTDASAMRTEIGNVLTAVAALGPNSYSANAPTGDVQYGAGLPEVHLQIDNDASGRAGVCVLIMHWKVWRRLGWDPLAQDRANGDERGEYDVDFRRLDEVSVVVSGSAATVPVPGAYWQATFRTRRVGARATGASSEEQTSDGKYRVYRPATSSGVSVVDNQGGQELYLGVSDALYCEGQIGRPPSDATIDGSAVDATRWWLMKAPYRASAEESPRELYQVFRASWVDDDGTIDEDDGGRIAIHIDRFEDPRLFGIDEDRIGVPLAVRSDSKDLQVKPLAALRYSPAGELDYAHHVLLRLLLSTGTASISGTEDADDPPVLTAGDNDHPDAGGVHHHATDAEIADLGLAIPHELVDWDSFLAAANEVAGGWASPLMRCVVAWAGPMQAAVVLRQVMQGRGLSMGLAGGKYSLFATHGGIDAAAATVDLGGSSWHGSTNRPGFQPAVEIRAIEPVDRWEIKTGRHPEEGSYQVDTSIKAVDPGARHRQGRRTESYETMGLIPDVWIPRLEVAADSWRIDAVESLGSDASVWRAKPHMRLTVDVQRRVGQDLFPGDVVTVSTEWAPDLDRGYGVTSHPARVLKAKHHLDGGHVTLHLQLEGSPGGRRRWAPVARLVDDVTTLEERYDAATFTWSCYQDHAEHGDPGIASDVEWFAEPEWSNLGGGMLVYGWQYNGVEWRQSFSFVVSSVDTAAHTITATGAHTGTFYERMYTILIPAPYDVQTAAWVKARFLVVTKANGRFGGANTRGWRLS